MPCFSSSSPSTSTISGRPRRPRITRERKAGMNGEQQPQVFKVVIVGDHRVGKTSLLRSWRGESFEPFSMATIGFDLCIRDYDFSDGSMRLQVWDTAGQERFNCVTTVQFRNAKGIVLVYDVSFRPSFDRIVNYWIDRVDAFMDESVPIFLVANKIDLPVESKVVTSDEGERLATIQSASGFYETSAKDGRGVESLFDDVARIMSKTWGIIRVNVKEQQSFCQHCGRGDEGILSDRLRGRRLSAQSRTSQQHYHKCCKGAPQFCESIGMNSAEIQRSPFEPRALPRS